MRTLRGLNTTNRRGAPACNPAGIIRQSPMTEIIRHRNGDTGDIIETILAMDAQSARWVQGAGLDCLRGATERQTLENVWRFVRFNLRYRADQVGLERVKSPGALFTSGVGDCKSFSIAEAALLRALGFSYRYRFTAYEPGDFTHVYVVADSSEGPVILDAVHTRFDEEVPYRRKKDIRPGGAGLSGIGSINLDWSRLAITGGLLILAYQLLSK